MALSAIIVVLDSSYNASSVGSGPGAVTLARVGGSASVRVRVLYYVAEVSGEAA